MHGKRRKAAKSRASGPTYRKTQREQVEFEDFYLSFGGRLRSDNRSVRLAKLVPWAEIESHYAELFNEPIEAAAISARVDVASLVIKEKPGLSDEETVGQIWENPYLQYFLPPATIQTHRWSTIMGQSHVSPGRIA